MRQLLILQTEASHSVFEACSSKKNLDQKRKGYKQHSLHFFFPLWECSPFCTLMQRHFLKFARSKMPFGKLINSMRLPHAKQVLSGLKFIALTSISNSIYFQVIPSKFLIKKHSLFLFFFSFLSMLLKIYFADS